MANVEQPNQLIYHAENWEVSTQHYMDESGNTGDGATTYGMIFPEWFLKVF